MLTVFLTMLEQMLGIFLLIAAGYVLNKTKTITPEGRGTLSKLCVDVFLPALIFKTMCNQCSVESLKTYGVYFLYGCLFMALAAFVSVAVTKRRKFEDRETEGLYRYALCFPNTSSIATPVVLAVFGELGFYKYSLFWLGYRYLTFMWGIPQLVPSNQPTRKDKIKKLFSPALTATFAGSAVGIFDLGKYIPNVVMSGIDKLGSCYSAVSLLIVGYIVANYSIRRIACIRQAYMVSLIRLIVFPCAFYVLSRLLRFPEEICTMVVLTFACPCGMNIVLFPAAYGRESELGASIVMLSTVFSIVTIPLLYALL